MTSHYPHMLTLTRLRMPVHLGFYDAERAHKQDVEISVRLYYATPPAAAGDDHAPFHDYAKLAAELTDYMNARQFRLLEFMANDMFRHMRAWYDANGGEAIKLWLKVDKVQAPVPGLQEGASYILSDLPAGATAVANWP